MSTSLTALFSNAWTALAYWSGTAPGLITGGGETSAKALCAGAAMIAPDTTKDAATTILVQPILGMPLARSLKVPERFCGPARDCTSGICPGTADVSLVSATAPMPAGRPPGTAARRVRTR